MSPFVHLLIDGARHCTARMLGDYGLGAARVEIGDDGVAIERREERGRDNTRKVCILPTPLRIPTLGLMNLIRRPTMTVDFIDVNSKIYELHWAGFLVDHSLHITRLPPHGPPLQ